MTAGPECGRRGRVLEVAAAVSAGVSTTLAYFAWLGWHEKQVYDARGIAHGPYETWQVLGLAVTLAALAFVGGWLRQAKPTAIAMTLVLVVVWSVDAATQASEDASLWPVGAVLLAIGSAAGLSLATLLGTILRRLSGTA